MKHHKAMEDFDRVHWERLVRTMIEVLGIERFNEILIYVCDEMNADRKRLYHFAVETRRWVEH